MILAAPHGPQEVLLLSTYVTAVAAGCKSIQRDPWPLVAVAGLRAAGVLSRISIGMVD
jgi:hypothetical protein